MTMHEGQFKLKTYRNVDAGDLTKLFEAVFKQKVDKKLLQAKYDTAILGNGGISSIAYHGDQAVAFWGAIPYPGLFGNKHLWIAHTCDYITLPQYQRQGLSSKLALKSCDLMRRNGIAFAFGFHSEQTYGVAKKLGWRDNVSMARFNIPVQRFPAGRFLAKTGFSRKIYRKYILYALSNRMTDRHLFTNVFNEKYLSILYSAQFMTYKSFSPNYVVKLGPCRIWLKVSGYSLYIGAINGLTQHNVDDVLRDLKILANKLLVNEIHWHISRNTDIFKILSTRLTPQDSWKISCQLFDESINSSSFRLNYADFDNY